MAQVTAPGRSTHVESEAGGGEWGEWEALDDDAPPEPTKIAATAFSGGGARLPYLDRIQRAFGRHDVSHVQAFLGGEQALAATRTLGASAFAMGEKIAFADTSPSLHVVAHEAVHVLQQRAGLVSPGLGAESSQHEATADEVADAVVKNQNTSSLLDKMLGVARGANANHASHAVQRKSSTSQRAWKKAFHGQKSERANEVAFVSAPAGIRPHKRPVPGDRYKQKAIVKHGTRVIITRRTLQDDVAKRWAFVTTPNGSGFIEEQFLATNPPGADAKLVYVEKPKQGESATTLGEIVSKHYNIRGGNDERLYVQAVVYANRGRDAVFVNDNNELSWFERASRGKADEATLRIYKNAGVRHGQSVFLPSETFVQKLKKHGAISSGATAFSKAWRAAKSAVKHVVDAIKYVAGLAVGLVEGAFTAVKDIAQGIADTVGILVDVVTGDLTSLIDKGKKWIDVIRNSPAMIGEFKKAWTQPDEYPRGKFHGTVIGWALTTVLIAFLTGGTSGIAVIDRIATRFPKVVKALEAAGKLGELKTYGKAAKRVLGRKRLDKLKGVAGKKIDAEKAAALRRRLARYGHAVGLDTLAVTFELAKGNRPTTVAVLKASKGLVNALGGKVNETAAMIDKEKKKVRLTRVGLATVSGVLAGRSVSLVGAITIASLSGNKKKVKKLQKQQARINKFLEAMKSKGRGKAGLFGRAQLVFG